MLGHPAASRLTGAAARAAACSARAACSEQAPAPSPNGATVSGSLLAPLEPIPRSANRSSRNVSAGGSLSLNSGHAAVATSSSMLTPSLTNFNCSGQAGRHGPFPVRLLKHARCRAMAAVANVCAPAGEPPEPPRGPAATSPSHVTAAHVPLVFWLNPAPASLAIPLVVLPGLITGHQTFCGGLGRVGPTERPNHNRTIRARHARPGTSTTCTPATLGNGLDVLRYSN